MDAKPVGIKSDCISTAEAQSWSQSIDWYHEGETRIVELGNLRVEVRFVGRKGRRARIAITAPAGAVFQQVDSDSQASGRKRS